MQTGDAQHRELVLRLLADGGRNGRNIGEAFGQRREVKPGAADEDGQTALRPRLRQSGDGIDLIAADRIAFTRSDMAVKPMRDARHILVGWTRGEDAHLAIDLHRVGVDDDDVAGLGQRQRRFRLAAGGGPCNKHGVEGDGSLDKRFSHVLNVIADDADFLASKMRAIGEAAWLSRGGAFDIPLAGDPGAALAEARNIASGRTADINVVATERRRKKLLVSDMESTIVACECLDELADIAGIKPQIAAITERAMRGEIEFAGALRERLELLKGLPLEALDRVWRERIRLNPGAKALVATMKANGAHTLLVSGGFTFFTSRVAAAAGFDDHQSNVLIDDGKALTGEVCEPILGREAKLQALERALKQYGLQAADALAAGDGANDLAMIQRAGLGVAYHAKPVVAAAAGASIVHNNLTALLYLQGYREEEIVSA